MHSGLQCLCIIIRIQSEPERIDTVVCRAALSIVQKFIKSIICGPISSFHSGHTLLRPLNRCENIVHDIAGASLDLLVGSAFDIEHHLHISSNISLIEILRREEPILFRSSIELCIDIVHDITNILQIHLARRSMPNPNQLTTAVLTMGDRHRISTHNPDRSISNPDSSRAIVRVAEKNKLPNLIALHDLAVVAVQLGQNPNFLTVVQRTGSVKVTLASIQKWLEPIERSIVLKRSIARPDYSQNAVIGLAIRRTGRHRLSIRRHQVLQANLPIQTGSRDSFRNGRSLVQLIPQTVPRGSTHKHHLFNCMSHCHILLVFLNRSYAIILLDISTESSGNFGKI